MNYYSIWHVNSSMRQWERVNEALHEQQLKNRRDSTKFITSPQKKDQFQPMLFEAKQDDIFKVTELRPAAKQPKRKSLWTRIRERLT